MNGLARRIVLEAGQKVEIDPGQVARIAVSSLALRFAFGAGISVAAGLIGIFLGPKVGGLFLAFPAILPASLTLIANKDGLREAEIDSLGATMGGVALFAFALIAAGGIAMVGALPALGAALGAWVVVALALYFLVALIIRRWTRGPGSPPQPLDATR